MVYFLWFETIYVHDSKTAIQRTFDNFQDLR